MAGSVSRQLRARAVAAIPGGVDSPVRSFRAVGAPPLFATAGKGGCLFDADGDRYVDLLMSWGALILGHAHPDVQRALQTGAALGTGFGLSTVPEVELAELIKDAFPSIERVRLVNSGTEAVMSAVRVARGYTGRDKVLIFEGCYHGHSDGLLVRSGSGLATLGRPSSAGVPQSYAGETLVARYNDSASVAEACAMHGGDLAAILVEPVAGNMGVVPPAAGFLCELRGAADRTGALLIFDEVITGFRVAPGGAQELYGVQPDITTLGKIIGGGLPVGAFGGRREVMECLAPGGPVYQAGTLSGNPIAARAGAAVLKRLAEGNPHAELEGRASRLAKAIRAAAAESAVELHVARVGSMLSFFFSPPGPPTHYEAVHACSRESYGRFFRQMLRRRVLLAPSPFESCFLSLAHTQQQLRQVGRAAREALRSLSVEA